MSGCVSFQAAPNAGRVWDHYYEQEYDSMRTGSPAYRERLMTALQELGLTQPTQQALDTLYEGLEFHFNQADLGLCPNWEVGSQGLLINTRCFLAENAWAVRWDPRFVLLTAQRPPQKLEWEQLPCLPYSAHLRAQIVGEEDSVLFLGDDDLVSVYIAQGRSQPAEVVDIDPDVLSVLQDFPLELHQADLRQGLPARLEGRFSCVVTDPPYSAEGMSSFLQAARAALWPGGRLLLSTQPLLLEAQKHFPDLLEGFRLERTWEGLNRYPFPPEFAREIEERMSILGFPPRLSRAIFCPPLMYADLYEYRLYR